MPAKDVYPNIVYASVVESAANTLTFTKIETGYGGLQKTAWIIHRIEWFLGIGIRSLVIDNSDAIDCALVTSNLISALDLSQAALIDLYEFKTFEKSAVGFRCFDDPITRNFADLPGGGRIVLPYPLYLAVKGVSLASAVTVKARIFFTERELGDADWMELVQQTRLLT